MGVRINFVIDQASSGLTLEQAFKGITREKSSITRNGNVQRWGDAVEKFQF